MVTQVIKKLVQPLLDRKVDAADFQDQINSKTNKREYEFI